MAISGADEALEGEGEEDGEDIVAGERTAVPLARCLCSSSGFEPRSITRAEARNTS